MSVNARMWHGERGDDPDLAGADAALLRAAQRARREAAVTGRTVVVFKDGEIVWEKAVEEYLPQERDTGGDKREGE